MQDKKHNILRGFAPLSFGEGLGVRTYIFTFFIFFSGVVFGQNERIEYLSSKEYLEFEVELFKEFDKKYQGAYKYIDVDSLNNVIFFKEGKSKIDTLANYKILFRDYHTTRDDAIYGLIESSKEKIARIKTAYDNAKVYKGSALFEGFSLVKQDLPIGWEFVVSDNYLILRQIISYYDSRGHVFGTGTFYFKKIQ